MEFLRWRLAQHLHAIGIHRLCHIRWIDDGLPSYRKPDGSIWKPNINGFWLGHWTHC